MNPRSRRLAVPSAGLLLVTLTPLGLPVSGAAAQAPAAAAARAPSAAAGQDARASAAAASTWFRLHPAGLTSPALAARPGLASARTRAPHRLPLLLPHAQPGSQPHAQPGSRPGSRPDGDAARARTGSPAGPPPRVPSTALRRKLPSPALVRVFDGVNAAQNKAAAGFDAEPPDEALGAGNGFVVNFVNVTGAVFTAHGRRLAKPFPLNAFFKEPAEAFTSDPRVFYDTATRSWFATILEVTFDAGGAATESHVDLAVSTTPNPNRAWRVYRVPTSNPRHTGCPCVADYPILGMSAHNVYLSTNEFTGDLNHFNGAQLYAISKRQLVAGRPRPRVVLFENLRAGGAPGFHVQPATTYGRAPAEFLMSSLDPNNTFDNRLAVWAVTREQAVSTKHRRPTLTVRVIRSERYSFPPRAKTPAGFCSACSEPTTGVVDTDFDAMQEVQYINGVLVGALNTGVTIPGDDAKRAGVAWFEVTPQLRGDRIGRRTHVSRQGYLATRGEYLLYPHLNMTPNGSMALVFGLGGPGTFLSAGFALAAPGRGFGPIRLAAAGVTTDNGRSATALRGGVGRWGDYSSGEIIPGTNRVWLATQYIPGPGTGLANWGNAIFKVRLR